MRWFLGVCSIRVLAKDGDPYYEPTIVVDDILYVQSIIHRTKAKAHSTRKGTLGTAQQYTKVCTLAICFQCRKTVILMSEANVQC